MKEANPDPCHLPVVSPLPGEMCLKLNLLSLSWRCDSREPGRESKESELFRFIFTWLFARRWRAEDDLRDSVLPFYHVSSKSRTGIVRPGY